LRDVTFVSRQLELHTKSKTPTESIRRDENDGEKLPDLTLENAERALYMLENDEHDRSTQGSQHDGLDDPSDIDVHDTGGEDLYGFMVRSTDCISAWIPGQGVRIDYAAIIEILIQQLYAESPFFFVILLI
jgi:vacuole morphology and inheritance protein 14